MNAWGPVTMKVSPFNGSLHESSLNGNALGLGDKFIFCFFVPGSIECNFTLQVGSPHKGSFLKGGFVG